MKIWLLAIALVVACGEPREPGVVLWHAYTGLERDALEQSAATWNREHPTTPITLVAVPYDAFADKLTSAIPGGNGPDLFIYPHDRIGDWSAAGVIEPIEYWVDDARAGRFSSEAIEAMAYNGSLWGLPLAVKSLAMYYRTDLVDHAPASTDELVALAPRMHAAGGFALAYANVDLYGHAPWLHGFGGRVMNDDTLMIATPEAATAMTFARSLVANGVVPADAQGPLVASLFNEGRTATVMSGPWFVTDIAKGVPWKVAPLPIVSATGKPAAPFLGVEGILMSTRARDKDLAFAVMDALTSDAQATMRARVARQVVANVHAYDEPDIASDPVLAAFRAQTTVTMPKAPGMRMVWTTYRTALGEVLAGRADPAAQLLSVEREVHRYLEHL
ncbi:MAG TPA: extracellular solute-binding protein [Kofleriaceae bacterium]|nr:extracellular solute-binding protein [Kofleriaceae bacterium]